MNITIAKLDKISDICISIGQVIFASVFIDPLLSSDFNWSRIFAGLIFATLAWILSLIAVQNN